MESISEVRTRKARLSEAVPMVMFPKNWLIVYMLWQFKDMVVFKVMFLLMVIS